jgi:hypothetical protein
MGNLILAAAGIFVLFIAAIACKPPKDPKDK